MKDIKQKIKRPCLPRLHWLIRITFYLSALALAILSVAETSARFMNGAAEPVFYAVTAILVIFSFLYLVKDISEGINHKLRPCLESNFYVYRFLKDYRYRTVVSACTSLTISVIFALYNALFGIINHSVWFGALAFYYILLIIMRYRVIRCEKTITDAGEEVEAKEVEWKLYKGCGRLFLFLTFALGLSVIQITFYGQGKHYSEVYAIAMAAYTFYKIIVSVMNMFKAGKLKSLLVLASRSISCADALVSIVSLQTSMILCFDSDTGNRGRIMNSVTGGCACIIILGMGISMIRSSKKNG